MPLTARHVFTLHVDLAEPIDVGQVPSGHLRIIPITGGTVDGPELSGTILPGGADWNLSGTDGFGRLWARYDLSTDNGAVVGVINEGAHRISAASEPAVDSSNLAIITRPVFEASAGAPSWLNTGSFAGILRVVGHGRVNIEVSSLVIQPLPASRRRASGMGPEPACGI